MMTRSMDRPESPPKGRHMGVGSQPPPRLQAEGSGGVSKRRVNGSSPTQRSVKQFCSKMTQEECVAQLKQLLPKVSGEEEASISELDLVERTIAYIAHLENILSTSNTSSINQQVFSNYS
ncbi:PREDICTED: uncharacterized protein LOC109581205 isoform X2 [Amphimedon queenslandica]|uniref:BHLH domain-containing protein n=1 Tax=Amphimedon queenslandica TaxID=400682 RepID=A0AAN0J1P7_AMPQE|nr:PREDICTED: uncharacterized protein LOC109581205 isoform X2 [Amphimedon queenslandica]|eukprot:XP_019850651.1 PREDICTED: uncharacterized protein LOC109581205 isoform X2 [Amphimedon queenslandica]